MKLKHLLVGAMLAVSALAMLADAAARPMGGGRSFGRQSGSVSRMAPTPAPAPRPAATPSPAAPGVAPGMVAPRPASPWRGIVGGALLGLGLGALMSQVGFGGGMFGALLMIILLVMVVSFVLRRLRGGNSVPMRPVPAPFSGRQPLNVIQMPDARLPEPVLVNPAPALSASAGAQPPPPHTPWGMPADFDTDAFLRHAKSNFIRMQAAWDKGDSADLHEFTTPEVYAEIKMQMQERGAQTDFTDVVTLDAALLGIDTTATDYLASVRFDAQIREAPGAPALPFREVWNLAKPMSGATGWMLAGIQQLD